MDLGQDSPCCGFSFLGPGLGTPLHSLQGQCAWPRCQFLEQTWEDSSTPLRARRRKEVRHVNLIQSPQRFSECNTHFGHDGLPGRVLVLTTVALGHPQDRIALHQRSRCLSRRLRPLTSPPLSRTPDHHRADRKPHHLRQPFSSAALLNAANLLPHRLLLRVGRDCHKLPGQQGMPDALM